MEQKKIAEDKEKKLYCMVVNSSVLETGLESECVFDHSGGFIGSGKDNHWRLTSHEGLIKSLHCSIQYVDDSFCLIDHSGLTRINNSKMPLEIGSPVALNQGDLVHIGDYEIKIDIASDEKESVYSVRRSDLSSMFPEETGAGSIVPEGLGSDNKSDPNITDPLLALGSEDNEYTHKKSYEKMVWGDDLETMESDYDHQMDALVPNRNKDSSKYQYRQNIGAYVEDDSSYLATGPLMRGLGVELSYSDHSGEMQYFAQEMGASLKETINGLLELHHEVSNNRYGVLNKNFQPIIDNPLKMGLDYTTTVKLMYDSEASLVHLAAPAAIRENIKMIVDHQKAVHRAITESLEKVLESFSPEALMGRFVQYRSARNLSKAQSRDEWAWNMYKAYHEELISDRQTGFNKLFWEVFDQVYDREMRMLEKNMKGDEYDF